MTARWRCWLAAELAAALLLATGCNGFGDESQADAAPRRPPVVVLVLDELPTDDLLRPDGSIDEERFPNFAELASISTWFPNAHTVYDSTFKAVPSILDGRLPRERTASDIRSHKPNGFHLMDRLGYDVFKVESASALCPPDICPTGRTRRPGVLRRLAGGGRPARFHRWVGSIRRRPRPAFYFQHTLMPHEPWLYLPSGRQSRPAGNDPVPGINQVPGFDDRGLSVQNHLRHLLQVGYTDRLVGDLLARLKRTGLLEDALVIVTADHGYSFRVGVKSRRLVDGRNVEQIAPVPTFVKAPSQMEPEVNRSLVRNIDLLATIADLLDTRLFYKQDGRSAFSDEVRARKVVELPTRDFRQIVRIGVPELERRRARLRRRWARLFGTGAESALLFGDPWAMAYRIGPHRDLLDRRVDELRVRSAGPVTARVANAPLLEDVTGDAEVFPTRISGPLRGLARDDHRDLALALNGRIRAVGRSFDLYLKRREFFSLQVPETALRRGSNRVELFEVRPDESLVRLYGAL